MEIPICHFYYWARTRECKLLPNVIGKVFTAKKIGLNRSSEEGSIEGYSVPDAVISANFRDLNLRLLAQCQASFPLFQISSKLMPMQRHGQRTIRSTTTRTSNSHSSQLPLLNNQQHLSNRLLSLVRSELHDYWARITRPHTIVDFVS